MLIWLLLGSVKANDNYAEHDDADQSMLRWASCKKETVALFYEFWKTSCLALQCLYDHRFLMTVRTKSKE